MHTEKHYPYRYWKLLAWAGPVYVVGEALSWAWIGKFLPPPAEYWTAEETYQFFLDHGARIRLGMMLTLIFATMYFVWSTVVSRLIAKIEGPGSVMSTIELQGGFATVIVTFGSVVAWLSASLHTDLKTPQDIKTISDYGWMWFNPTAFVTVLQFLAFGLGVISDRRPIPLFPRWVPWFTFAMAMTLLLAFLTPFFSRGPFAWHGLFTYYVGLGGYFLWIAVTCVYVLKAVYRLDREARATTAD